MRFTEGTYLQDDLIANTEVAVYLHKQLSADDGVAVDYLDSRAISMETAGVFALGYYPREGPAIPCQHNGKVSYMLEAMRGKLIIPIQDSLGYCISLASRPLGAPEPGSPKYLNTRFTKRQVLYNWHRASRYALETNSLYLVEGYFDVIALYQANVRNAAAVMGAAFSWERAIQIKAMCDVVRVIADQDEAGESGMERIRKVIEELDMGLACEGVTLPQGVKDIDDLYRLGTPESISILNILRDYRGPGSSQVSITQMKKKEPKSLRPAIDAIIESLESKVLKGAPYGYAST